MTDNKPKRRSCEDVDIDPGWYPGQPELEDDPAISELGNSSLSAVSASAVAAGVLTTPEHSLPSAGGPAAAAAGPSAISAFSNASSLGPAAAAAAAAMAGARGAGGAASAAAAAPAGGGVDDGGSGGGAGEAARSRAPPPPLSVPTVLGKLQKWGDYVAVGAPVAPTRFVPMKTPLSTEILDSWSLPAQPKHRLTVPQMVAEQAAAGRKIGLILDLSNHDCLYSDDIPPDVQYIHIQLVAKELPPPDFVSEVVAAANAFWEAHPDQYIAVHCAYGFNRTGFVVCCYLIECCGLTVDEALASFATSRPPGVKHEAFRAELQARYGLGGPGMLLANHASGNSLMGHNGGAHHGSPDNSSFGGYSPSCRSLDLKDMCGSAGPGPGPNSLGSMNLGSGGFGSLGGTSGPSPLSRNAFAMESLLASVAAAAAAGAAGGAAPVTPGQQDGYGSGAGAGGGGGRAGAGMMAVLGMPGRGACSYNAGHGGGHGQAVGMVAGSTASGSPRAGGSGGLAALGGGGSHAPPPWAVGAASGHGAGAGAGGAHPQQQHAHPQQQQPHLHHHTHTFAGVGALGGNLIVSSVPAAPTGEAAGAEPYHSEPQQQQPQHHHHQQDHHHHGVVNGHAHGQEHAAPGQSNDDQRAAAAAAAPSAPWHATASSGGESAARAAAGQSGAGPDSAFMTSSAPAVASSSCPARAAAATSVSAFAAAAQHGHSAAIPCSGHNVAAAHAHTHADADVAGGGGGLASGVSVSSGGGGGGGGRRLSDERTSSGAYGENESLGVNDRYILQTMRQHMLAQQQAANGNATSIPEEDGGGGNGGDGGGSSSSRDSPLRGISSNSLTDYSDISIKPGAAAVAVASALPAPSVTPPRSSAHTGRYSRASLDAIDWGAAASEAAADAALTAAEAARRMAAE